MAFQASKKLIVREYQYKIAEEIVENLLGEQPGKAYQCLMGRGKTHVILPLIMLLWYKKNEGKKLLFVVLPASLLGSQAESIQLSVENILPTHVFRFEFHRDTHENFNLTVHGSTSKAFYFARLLRKFKKLRKKVIALLPILTLAWL